MLILGYGCKKPYDPPVVAGDASYLVVEGIINNGGDPTIIKLSRTIPLSSTKTPQAELGAQLTILAGDASSGIDLVDLGNGSYYTGTLNLDNTLKYRLRIRTAIGQVYMSDPVQVKNAPQIDSLEYKVQNNGVQIYVNSHDPNNNTRYYRWEFDETWKYVSAFQSGWKYENGIPVFRNPFLRPEENIYECYKTNLSHQILLGSSAKLSQDVISKEPVDFAEAGSGKISFGYSILLRQYALTPEAFTYWQNLKKNTEQLGSIFDAQPSSISGNIHNTANPKEPVIGYISAGSVVSKRIFIDKFYINLFVPYYVGPPDGCTLASIKTEPKETFLSRLAVSLASGDSILVKSFQPPGATEIESFGFAPNDCVDCRLKTPFGTNVKPAYWPY